MIAGLVVGSTGLNWIYHSVVVNKLESIEEKGSETVLKTKWISGGKERSWTSTFKEYDPDETKSEFFSRHRTELAEAMAEFPEDSPPSGGGSTGGGSF